MTTMDQRYIQRINTMAPQKNGRYNGSLYTMTGSGAQILMNTHTIATATTMQFLPPIRTKSTMCSTTPSATQSFMSALNLRDTKMQSNFVPSTPDMAAAATVAATTAGIPSKFDTHHYGISSETKTEGYPLFSAIKGFFSSLLRPIISTTATMHHIPITTETNGGYATSNGKFHETSTNVYMNVMPADIETSTFFDCDDYVDSEDTVDFIADTTPKFDDLAFEFELQAMTDTSPKASAYFDCVSTLGEKEAEKCERVDALTEVIKSDPVIVEPIQEPIEIEQLVKKCSPTQQQSARCGLISAKPSVDKPTCYQNNTRKRSRRRPHKAIRRTAKSLAVSKNRNEKHRHELEQLIHDDIECIHESASDYGQDDEYVIDSDVDARVRFDSESSVAKPMPSFTNPSTSPLTALAPSTEPIFTEGTSSMFTCFISFGAPNVRPRPPPKLTPRRLQRWTSSDRPLHYRLSESESEDNYIVYDGVNSESVSTDDLIGSDYGNVRRTYGHQRQISECSDDFICFEYDDNDLANHSDGTTDEEFSQSDDSDDEASDSGSDVCYFDGEPHRFSTENHPPDSGFEEKKVTFNLCPRVHEIRAWKFAYREARKGKWEQVGRDRERFEKKINELGSIIAPVLAVTHREKIYNERFRPPASHEQNDTTR